MPLSVSPRFKSQWISQSWAHWKEWAQVYHLPVTGFIKSRAAVVASGQKAWADPDFAEFAVSTCC
eukprot:7106934-Alexandrium_andersonii.AAC.1